VQFSTEWLNRSNYSSQAKMLASRLDGVGESLPRRALALLIMAVLIFWSRLHIGIHYAGDVAGGAASEITAALAVRLCHRENSRLDAFATKIL
jgi:undecaprenyl-diphosphatase